MKKVKTCTEPGCHKVRATADYCRFHYIKNWREIVQERRVKAREKLSRYVENLSEKFPEEYQGILESDIGDEEALKKRLHDFGFKEEFEGGEKNPFAATDVKDLLEDIEQDD